MRICAVILNYFGHEDTITCVRALVNQNDLEKIIIVENSVDSYELSRLKDNFKNDGPVEIMAPKRNLGFSGGVNFALNYLNKSTFDAFLLLNNDTIVPPGSIQRLSKGLSQNNFDMAAPVIYCYPEQHKVCSRGYFYNRFVGLVTQRELSVLPGTQFFLGGCCVLIRRQVFECIGLLDTSFFMYGEDVEFCSRAVQSGFQIGIIDKAHIYHKGTVSSQFNSFFYEYHINRCHFLLCNKLSKNKTEQRLSFVIKIFSLTMRALLRSLKYKNTNAISGYTQAVLELTNAIFLCSGETG